MKDLLRLICLLLVFPLAVFSFSYAVDPANVFYDEYEETLVQILLSGQNAEGVQNMDDRRFLRLYAQQRTAAPHTLVLGSSRAMQITPAVTGSADTFVAGVTGSDLRDVIGAYELFEQQGLAPQTVVLSLEMWYLSAGNLDNRALAPEYEAFCTRQGLQPLRTASAELSRYKNFFTFTYFQSAVSYAAQNGLQKQLPTPTGEVYAATPVKRADGSYGYEEAFRTRPQAVVDRGAADKQIVDNIAAYFTGVDEGLYAQLDAFVTHLQQQGVQVRLLVSPVHPDYYAYMLQNPQRYATVFDTEERYRQLARNHGLALYGSFDPTAVGASAADFYDEVHPKESALLRYYDTVVE